MSAFHATLGRVLGAAVRFGSTLEIYGTGDQSRCFTNVSDVVGALLKLIDCPKAVGEVINIGTTDCISIRELADKVIRMTGSKSTTSGGGSSGRLSCAMNSAC